MLFFYKFYQNLGGLLLQQS